MNEKDKKIQELEKKVARLERALNAMQANIQKLTGRIVRTDESIRRISGRVDEALRKLRS